MYNDNFAPQEGDIVEVVKPEYLAGRLVRLTKERFKWPAQNFWVVVCRDIETDDKVIISSYRRPTRIPKYRSIDSSWGERGGRQINGNPF
jgi:hypothetical protein